MIIIGYALLDDEAARRLEPSALFVDGENRTVNRGSDPAEVPPGSELLRGDRTATG
ncbi:hypothetical protein OOZ19_03695 [Saccharopolyspora sp. NFXS83]|uniref:hypothetical protein n=1 Tax=Saccharopolyspora sp. NFXS83 TaxID=2993560 RepID=UPI00224A89BF|nr:hypothetical protein [Saccharopolyspora sp. NFXS83]MCX2729332.1 hypothetical protein [Saccharopolyspora sp. NFXS83]